MQSLIFIPRSVTSGLKILTLLFKVILIMQIYAIGSLRYIKAPLAVWYLYQSSKIQKKIYQSCPSCQELLQAKVTAPPCVGHHTNPTGFGCLSSVHLFPAPSTCMLSDVVMSPLELASPVSDFIWKFPQWIITTNCFPNLGWLQQISCRDGEPESTKPNKAISCIRRRGLKTENICLV